MIILVVSCHYDDAEIGCCETIRKHTNNKDTVIYAVTDSDEHRTGDPQNRLIEQIDALTHIGINSSTSLLLFKSTDDIQDIISKLDLYKPSIVFSPWFYDTHQAHRRASSIGQSVGRKRDATTYFYSSSSTTDFEPNIYNLIDFNKKETVLRCFESQVKCGAINIDIIKKREAYWGSLISYNTNAYAEAFVSRKALYKI